MIKLLRKIRWLILPLLICAGICVLMKTVLFLGYVPTASMEPTIPAGSWILGYRPHGTIQKGDIVIFEHNGKTLVKRVTAVSNEIIMKNGIELRIPESHYYLLGDNKNCSFDSRFWDDPFVSKDNIIAKLICLKKVV